VLAVVSFAACLFWLVSSLRGANWETIFFFVVGMVGGLWALWMATTVVTATNSGLTVKRLTSSQSVDYQQIRSSSDTGRLFRILAILYHPRNANGLVNTEEIRSLLMPGLAHQDDLVQLLEQRVTE
jgi:hypothetical protein